MASQDLPEESGIPEKGSALHAEEQESFDASAVPCLRSIIVDQTIQHMCDRRVGCLLAAQRLIATLSDWDPDRLAPAPIACKCDGWANHEDAWRRADLLSTPSSLHEATFCY